MESTLTDLQKETIAGLEERLEQIALLPAVISRLAAINLDSPDASDEIIALVRSDPPLALRLLRMANNDLVLRGGESRINTIPSAILRVGAVGLTQMILSLAAIETFAPSNQGQRNLWIHSIQTAIAARRLAVLRPDLGLGLEECFLAGLLHDIGRFLIFENRPDQLALIDEAHVTSPLELVSAEIAICGFDHATLGYEICRRWNLPESVCEMVRVHHMYGADRGQVPADIAGLVELVQEADCFSFGLLQHPSSSFHSEKERRIAIEASLYPLDGDERVIQADRLADQAINIDNEARRAASMIRMAYL